MAEGVGVGLGVELGVGLGVGVGTGAAVEPEDALTAPPPQPATIKRREKSNTQRTTFGPMRDDLLHTATLDATELLDVGHGSYVAAGEFSQKANRPLRGGRFSSWLAQERPYWKNSPMDGATADAPGMSPTLSNCSIVRSSDWC